MVSLDFLWTIIHHQLFLCMKFVLYSYFGSEIVMLKEYLSSWMSLVPSRSWRGKLWKLCREDEKRIKWFMYSNTPIQNIPKEMISHCAQPRKKVCVAYRFHNNSTILLIYYAQMQKISWFIKWLFTKSVYIQILLKLVWVCSVDSFGAILLRLIPNRLKLSCQHLRALIRKNIYIISEVVYGHNLFTFGVGKSWYGQGNYQYSENTLWGSAILNMFTNTNQQLESRLECS